jgi:PPE-repeat protein
MRDHSDEYLDMDSGIGMPPDYGDGERLGAAVASGAGAGTPGFAGTAGKENTFRAAGLTKLTGGEFGGGPRMPMMPGTWDHDVDQDPARPTEPREGG